MPAINKNDLVSSDASEAIVLLKKRVLELQDALVLAMKAGTGLNTELSSKSKISAIQKDIAALKSNIESLTKAEAALAAARKDLSTATNNSTKATTSATAAEKAAAIARRQATTESKNKSTASSNEARALRDLATQLRAKTALEKAEAAATLAAEKASRAKAKADKDATGSSKTLGGALKGVAMAAGQLIGVYLSVQGIISLFKMFRDAAKDLDSLKFSMAATIKNTFELAQTQYMMLDLSKRYGLNIVEITNSYTKFRAAVNESNMTIDEGQKVFASMAKASAVLGMTMDKTNDVFLALEQMVGKGSVMSEELRRQMGQHLPVAVTAMAVAAQKAGISVSGTVEELMKLMKAGKVAAADVLPYFGDAVEEQLGIKATKFVDTLATAQANLTLAWIEFVKAMDKAPVLAKVYKTIGAGVSWLTDLIKSETQRMNEGAGVIVNDVNDRLVEGTTEKEKQVILDAEILRLQQLQTENLKKQESAIANDPNKPKPGFKNMARNVTKLATGGTERFDATFNVPNVQLQNALTEAAAVKQALKLIMDNYNELIKVKEDKPILPDETALAKAKSDALKIFKDGQAEELAIYIQSQEEMRAQAYKNVTTSGADDLDRERADAGLKMDMEKNVTDFKIKQNDELKSFVKGNIVELADAERVAAQVKRDLQTKQTEFGISESDREYNEYISNMKKLAAAEKKAMNDKKDQDIANIETGVTNQVLGLTQKLPKGPIKDKRAYGATETQYGIDVLAVQEQGLKDLLSVHNLTIDEEKRFQTQLQDVQTAAEKAKRDQIQETYDLQKELTLEGLKYSADAIDKTFNVFAALQDNKMQRLEEYYTHEINLAGSNTAMKLAAETEYAREKNKMLKKQAILQKAQSVASIVMNTAVAIMQTLGETGIFGLPLTPIIAGIGALELAAALATPIPNYEEGGKHPGGKARFSEKGKRELFIPDGGKPFLTPPKETIADMPSGMFFPHDETQKILANAAMNNFINEGSSINMGVTNALLKDIAGKTETSYMNGYKIVTTNNIKGKYATRS